MTENVVHSAFQRQQQQQQQHQQNCWVAMCIFHSPASDLQTIHLLCLRSGKNWICLLISAAAMFAQLFDSFIGRDLMIDKTLFFFCF
jgi:hypothetical protein